MNIIYISQACSNNKFHKYLEERCINSIPNAQKYHRLMLEGLATVSPDKVYSLSGYPVRIGYKHFYYKSSTEIENQVIYKNVFFINLMFLRQIFLYFNAKKEIKRIYKNDNDVIIVCDIWYYSMATAARRIGKKLKLPVVGIVTDVPEHTLKSRRNNLSYIKRKFAEHLENKTNKSMGTYDGYLLLTQPMNEVVNKNARPYIVLEGHADSLEKKDLSCKKKRPKILLYAGGIHKEYGIGQLVDAFIKGNFTNWELNIYGKGNFESELIEICKKYNNVKYFGYKENEFIINEQKKATLLVNPRITDGEYVKYSFPSKTFEYMASGTPLLMTELPWMPEEYKQYIYFFENETEVGFQKTLQKVLNLDEIELNNKGKLARNFVIQNKSNTVQAKKFYSFLSGIKC
ncbi:MAG: glycosyltransferase [Treponema sp.]